MACCCDKGQRRPGGGDELWETLRDGIDLDPLAAPVAAQGVTKTFAKGKQGSAHDEADAFSDKLQAEDDPEVQGAHAVAAHAAVVGDAEAVHRGDHVVALRSE